MNPSISAHKVSNPVQPARPKRNLAPVWIVAAVVALGGAVTAVSLMMKSPKAPRLNDPTVEIAKYVAGDQFPRLPVDQQLQLIDVLENRDDNGELKKALDEGKLSESEYRAAKLEANVAQLISRSQKYQALPNSPQRSAMLVKLFEKQEKSEREDKEAASKGIVKKPYPKVDEALFDLRVSGLPEPYKSRVGQYRTALERERTAWEKMRDEKGKSPASAPTTRAGKE